jgi:hypothetical protein
MVPVPWQAVEPQQGRFQWEQLDRWVVWAKSTKRAIMIGPLLDLRPGGIPGWVLPSLKDIPKFEQLLYRFVREVVIRYAPVDPTWHVAAGVNSNEVAALTSAEMTQLVRQAVVAVRQVVPEARILVEAADPFGERSSADNGARTRTSRSRARWRRCTRWRRPRARSRGPRRSGRCTPSPPRRRTLRSPTRR